MNSNKILSFINLLSAALLLITAGLFFYNPVEIGDIWWHLKAGAFIHQNSFVPITDPFPFAQEKTPWILTQWLGSLFYFLVYNIKGFAGLKLVRAVLLAGVILLFLRFSWRKIPKSLSVILGLLLMLALDSRAHLRPYLFNFLFIQAFLICLLSYPKTQRFRTLVPIIIMGVFWSNIHLGSFMYGLTLTGIFALGALVQFLVKRNSPDFNLSELRQIFFGYLFIFLGFILTFIFNPYGIHGALHPWRTLFVENYIAFGTLRQTIGELQPPTDIMSWLYTWGIPTVIIGILSIYQDSKNRFRNLILLVVGAFLYLSGRRASIFYILTTLYVFIDSYPTKLLDGKANHRRILTGISLLLCVMFLLVAIKRQGQHYFIDGYVYKHHQLDIARQSPDPIIKLLESRNVTGRIFNDDLYGGYIQWHKYPILRPFTDTRQINLRAQQMYMAVLHHPEKYWPEMDKNIKFQAILLDANKFASRRALLYFLRRRDWQLAEVSADRVLFLRHKDAHGFYIRELRAKESDANISQHQQKLKEILQEGPIHPHNYVYMDPVATAVTLFELGYRGAALEQLVYSFELANTNYQHEMTALLLNQFSR